jgi:SAM-dependent methyltransferase
MLAPAQVPYHAHVGYRALDARRYERRRYGGLRRRLKLWALERAVLRALEGVSTDRPVLDVPCGTGILDRALSARGFRVIGSDISPAMLGLARERSGETLGGSRHVRADLERPPWRSGAFGAVVCARFLMLLPPASRPRVLATLAALTDGPLVATVCHAYTPKSATRALRRAIGMRAKESPRLTRDELLREAAAAGLRVERVVRLVPLFSEVWVVVLRTPR